VGGGLNLPHWLHAPAVEGKLHHFLAPVFAGANVRFDGADASLEIPLMVGTLVVIALSVALAYRMYVKKPEMAGAMAARFPVLHKGSSHKWYVDELYEMAVIGPLLKVSRDLLFAIVDVRVIDGLVNGIARVVRAVGSAYGRWLQTGQVQAYALAIALGTAAIVMAYTVGA
jgi:NADH-quinone oxidoreductase subunit L